MVEYPTRPIIQLLFAINMLPYTLIGLMWYQKSTITSFLYLAANTCYLLRVFITQTDDQFLSGQAGLMGNLFMAAYMVYSSNVVLWPSLPHALAAVAYLLCQLMIIHFQGKYLQTGSDAALKFFQTISIVVNIVYSTLLGDVFKGRFYLDWPKKYTA